MAFPWQKAFEFLCRAHDSGRLGHAYLIQGPRRSGKMQLAHQLAAHLNSSTLKNPDAVTQHPDVHTIAPESKSRRILVEQIRALEHPFHRKPNAGPYKIGIIQDCERLQPQAANAFLKTLEEPPRDSLLLLLTESPEALLDTIISRCIGVTLLPRETVVTERDDEKEELLRILQHVHGNGEDAPIAAAYSLARHFGELLGRIRAEVTADHEDSLKEEEAHYKDTTESKSYLDSREDYYKALTESLFARRRGELVEVLIEWWMDVLKLHQGHDGGLAFPDYREVTGAIAQELNFSEIMRRLQMVQELHDHLNRNIQEQLALEVAFLKACPA